MAKSSPDDPTDPERDSAQNEKAEQTMERAAALTRTPVTRTEDDLAIDRDVVLHLQNLAVYYGKFRAVRDVNLPVRQNEITAMIGPSGCGKSTVLRCINRMNDLVSTARVEGRVEYHGIDVGTRDHQAQVVLHVNLPSPDVIELWLRVSLQELATMCFTWPSVGAQLSPSPE